ncbi:phospholipase D-like domain-containing protein [Microbulbifer guangxiensis]|uniref:phospholipase D-like domain-containing protein n=1 Tax=Microbulbifer guangxiensis TaxID=2904249 RepID=UPI001F328A2C|nr:phospholipase D family protein [Microbulbifer guangxiensis]
MEAFPRRQKVPRPLLLLPVLTLLLCGCLGPAYFPEPPTRTESLHQLGPPDSALARVVDGLTAAHPGQTGVYPVTTAQDALAVRLAAIRAAQRSIDIQYFIFRRDESGRLLTHELIDAADRGVRVRFLLDDFTTGDSVTLLAALDQHPGIEVRLFNPFPKRSTRAIELLADFCQLQRRMHNKAFTVDGRVTFIGGRNLGDKYFGIDNQMVFHDLDIITIGAALPPINRQFDLYWNSGYSFPLQAVVSGSLYRNHRAALYSDLQASSHRLLSSDYGQRLQQSPVVDALSRDDHLWYWGEAEVLVDPPQKVAAPAGGRALYASDQLMQAITGAQRRLIIISPYVLPGPYYFEALLAAAARGVEIHLLTNSLASTDLVLVHGPYRKYREPMLRAGIHLYEMSGSLDFDNNHWHEDSRSLLHAKLFAVDDRLIYAGSFNFDQRSLYLNTELGLLIDVPGLAGKVTKNFTANIRQNAYTLALRDGILLWQGPDGVTHERDPGASALQRVGSKLSSWLPIEHLL